jgi:valyl-tRNA synthetase
MGMDHKYGGTILEQLEKIRMFLRLGQNPFHHGSQTFSTGDQIFVDLYNKGLIYSGYRMVNWDPKQNQYFR